jgi:hypothetical protein
MRSLTRRVLFPSRRGSLTRNYTLLSLLRVFGDASGTPLSLENARAASDPILESPAGMKPRQGWEDDFEKEDFFTKSPPPVKQARVQLLGSHLNLPVPQILSVLTPVGRCLIDSCSDVSIARRDVLTDVCTTRFPAVLGHLGGETFLCEVGTLR